MYIWWESNLRSRLARGIAAVAFALSSTLQWNQFSLFCFAYDGQTS